jgi:hypothetical protein
VRNNLLRVNPENKPTVTTNKLFIFSALSLINGILYFAIARAGGANLESFLKLSGKSADRVIFSVAIGACLVYTMFTYKTYESLSLKINSLPKLALSLLAPFSAAAFLTAGKEGALLVHFNPTAALIIGIALFLLRMVNCIDASVKFPHRTSQIANAWRTARENRNHKELCRLILTGFISVGYVTCTTDSIYHATTIISGWFGMAPNSTEALSFVTSIIGAIGTLPLIVYWSHRGLRQLTVGGEYNLEGKTDDPTDRYTYIGLLFVIPVMLGILGGATASTGAVFGQLGLFSQVTRIVTSTLYAACAGTPGMATLLRNTSQYLQKKQCGNKSITWCCLFKNTVKSNYVTLNSERQPETDKAIKPTKVPS